MSSKEEIIPELLPQHVAIIMDGNGRWAKKKGLLRAIGHENGVDALRKIATASAKLGVKYLTVYAFSSENWQRPSSEVKALMTLLVSSLKKEMKTLTDNEIRLTAIGQLDSLPAHCQKELKEVMRKTRHNTRMTLNLALSYSARQEIVDATQEMLKEVQKGNLQLEELSPEVFENYLYTREMPHPDLLIRTSGEYRISNYLLWQIAYAELYFTPVLWPDFTEEDLYMAIADYQKRERRFGKISEQINS